MCPETLTLSELHQELKELGDRQHILYGELREFDLLCAKKQATIKKEVLKNVPNELAELEREKKELRRTFLDKRNELNKQQKLIRKSKRTITKVAYLNDSELQNLKNKRDLKNNEYTDINIKIRELQQKIT